MGEERKVYRVLIRKTEGKRALGRPMVDGRMGSEGILGRLAEGDVEWIQLVRNRDKWRALVIR
jgi:hypothetical protein